MKISSRLGAPSQKQVDQIAEYWKDEARTPVRDAAAPFESSSLRTPANVLLDSAKEAKRKIEGLR